MEDTKKCLAGCDETDQLHNLYIDSIYGKLFVDLVGIEISETSYLCLKCRITMTSFKDFRDKVIYRVKSQSQTEISTKDFDEDDIMEQDQDANLEHIVTIKDEEILEPSYVEKIQKEPLKSIEPTKKKEISKISMNIRRLMAGLPKKANNSHLDILSVQTMCSTMCSFCFMDFKNITLLLEHLSIHNDKKIICPDCSCQFNTKDEMRSHYKKHLLGDGANIKIVQEDVKCQYCDNTYKTLTLLDRHENKRHKEELLMMLNVHLINPSKPIKNKETELENGESLELQEMTISVRDSRLKYDLYSKFDYKLKCKFCSEKFTSEAFRDKHVTVHASDTRPFKCPGCSETFTDQCNLRNHYYKHTPVLQFCCKIGNCTKKFYHKSKFISHQNCVHLDIRNFLCNFCPKAFKDRETLVNHIRGHTNERPFKCDICGNAFRARNHLKDHSRLHIGDLRYQCSYCEKKFVTTSKKKDHERCHTGLRPYACIICARNYRQKKLLKAHYASVHDLEISSFEIPNIDGSISRERVGEVLQRPFKRIQPANPVKLENIPNRSVK